jgi:hypothetical protein
LKLSLQWPGADRFAGSPPHRPHKGSSDIFAAVPLWRKLGFSATELKYLVSISHREYFGKALVGRKIAKAKQLGLAEHERALIYWASHVFVYLDQTEFTREYYGKPFMYRLQFMRRLCDRAKVKRYGFHGIRHLSASIL